MAVTQCLNPSTEKQLRGQLSVWIFTGTIMPLFVEIFGKKIFQTILATKYLSNLHIFDTIRTLPFLFRNNTFHNKDFDRINSIFKRSSYLLL